MSLTYADGRTEDVPKRIHQAFAALARGDASGNQQKTCLVWMLKLANPFDVAGPAASERAAGIIDGARHVGNELAKLIGGDAPWTLKHLGDVNDDGHAGQD